MLSQFVSHCLSKLRCIPKSRIIMLFHKITGTIVGADSSCPPPMYRPLVRRWASQADTSAMRQSIVRLRGITAFGRETSLSAFSSLDDLPLKKFIPIIMPYPYSSSRVLICKCSHQFKHYNDSKPN